MLEKMDSFFENRVAGYDEHMLTEIEGADEFYIIHCLAAAGGGKHGGP